VFGDYAAVGGIGNKKQQQQITDAGPEQDLKFIGHDH